MTAWDGKTFWAGYDKFSVGPESGNYTLSVGGHDWNSTAPDRMGYHNSMMFTTYDRDNDLREVGGLIFNTYNDPSEGNCARERKGGWWYSYCAVGQPTGEYMSPFYPSGLYQSWGDTSRRVCNIKGIVWFDVRRYCYFYSFKRMTFTLIPQ